MRLELSNDDLRPLVAAIVQETLALVDRLAPDRLAYTEDEAAQQCGIAKHALRDCRLRGELSGTKAGKTTLYARSELIRFVTSRRT